MQTDYLMVLATVIKAIDGSVLALVLFSVAVPPLVVAWAMFKLRDEIKAQAVVDHDRFEQVLRMYQDNVELVKRYEKTADGLQSVIHLSTKAITQMLEKINNNHFCPVVRQRSKVDE
jgi:hypothetical protein